MLHLPLERQQRHGGWPGLHIQQNLQNGCWFDWKKIAKDNSGAFFTPRSHILVQKGWEQWGGRHV